MPRRQSQLLATVSKFGFQFVIVVHLCVVVLIAGSFLGLMSSPSTTAAVTGVFAVAIIALAVVSLCAHAFEQGLQPEREIERYQQYGSVLKSILDQFDATDDPAEKLKIMRQMERAAYDEMRNFLLTYHWRSNVAI